MNTLKNLGILSTLLISTLSHAVEVKVAVAANFMAPLEAVASDYMKTSKDQIVLTSGSSGKFFAQIENGAPFDLYFSADQDYPSKLVAKGFADEKSRFTYAIGSLVLWSPDPKLVDPSGEVLKKNEFKHLAIANPAIAPYGTAAEETLRKLKLYDTLKPKLVLGENIAQAHGFIKSGNAELGFVPLSMVKNETTGSQWMVPANHYTPLFQDAVLILKSKQKSAAQKFLDFVKSKNARTIIETYGYTFKK